jgi:hypothetical protein
VWVINTMSSHSSDRLFRANYTVCSSGTTFKITSPATEVTCARHLHSATISFNFLLRVLGIRVCLGCGIRQEVNFLDDIQHSDKTVVLPQW